MDELCHPGCTGGADHPPSLITPCSVDVSTYTQEGGGLNLFGKGQLFRLRRVNLFTVFAFGILMTCLSCQPRSSAYVFPALGRSAFFAAR